MWFVMRVVIGVFTVLVPGGVQGEVYIGWVVDRIVSRWSKRKKEIY